MKLFQCLVLICTTDVLVHGYLKVHDGKCDGAYVISELDDCYEAAAGLGISVVNQNSLWTTPYGCGYYDNGIHFNSFWASPAMYYPDYLGDDRGSICYGRESCGDGNSNFFGCVPCPAGTYNDNEVFGVRVCGDCMVGKYNGQTGQSSCKSCGTGQYQNQNKQTECKSDCNAGSSINNARTTCTQCSIGQYQNQNKQTGCKSDCNAGSSINNARTACTQCNSGQYQNQNHQTGCTGCPTGTYNGQTGQTSCTHCIAGKFNNIVGQSSCFDCLAGKFNNNVGQSSCFNCPQGRFAEAAGFRPIHGLCKQCEIGKYGYDLNGVVPISSAIACKNCPQGFSQSSLGMTNCAQCAQHLYQDQEGQISCKGCDAGNFGDLTDTLPVSSDVVCKDCPQGYWQPTARSANCNLCSPGRYSTSSGLSGECPQWCGPGQEQTLLATSCQDCAVAKFRTNEKDPSNCKQCVAGKYQDQTGQPLCKNCMVGKYLPLLSIDKHDSPEDCKMCLVGRYAGITGQHECDICDSPSYQDEEGQEDCKLCVAGKIRTVSTGCTDCGVGKHQNEPAKSMCKECPIGYKSGTLGLAQCLQCGNGQYTDAEGQSTCKKCPWRGACQHLTTIHPKTRIGVAGPWYDRKPFVGTRLTLTNMIENGENAVQTNKRLYDRDDFITIGNNNVKSSCPATTRKISETECRDIHWSTGSPIVSDVETKRKHVSSRNIFFEATECPLENKIYNEETCRLGGGTPGYAIVNMDFYNPYNRLFYKCEQFADDQITEPGPYKNEPRGSHFAQSLVDECNRGRTVPTSVCNRGTSWSQAACNWGKKLSGGTLATGETRSSVMYKCYNGQNEVCRKKQFYKSANYYRSENICQNKVDSFNDCNDAADELGLVFSSKYKEMDNNNCRYPITSKEECKAAYKKLNPSEPLLDIELDSEVILVKYKELSSDTCGEQGVVHEIATKEECKTAYEQLNGREGFVDPPANSNVVLAKYIITDTYEECASQMTSIECSHAQDTYVEQNCEGFCLMSRSMSFNLYGVVQCKIGSKFICKDPATVTFGMSVCSDVAQTKFMCRDPATVTFGGNVCSNIAQTTFMCRDEAVPNGCIMHEDGHVTYNVDDSTDVRTQEDFCSYKTGKECICKSDGSDKSQCADATGLQLADLTKKEDYGTYYRYGEICSPSDSFDNAQECKVAAEWVKTNRPTVTGLTDIVVNMNTDTVADFSGYEVRTTWCNPITIEECGVAAVHMGTYLSDYVFSAAQKLTIPRGCYQKNDGVVFYNDGEGLEACTSNSVVGCVCETGYLKLPSISKPIGCFQEGTNFYWNNPAGLVDYKVKTSGKCTDDVGYGDIMDLAKCMTAAKQLELSTASETVATSVNNNGSPTGCLFYNNWGSERIPQLNNGASEPCGSNGYHCLCKRIPMQPIQTCGDGGCVCKRNDLPKGCSTYNDRAYWSDNSNENRDNNYRKVDIIPVSSFTIDSGSNRICVEKNNEFKFGFAVDGFTKQCLAK